MKNVQFKNYSAIRDLMQRTDPGQTTHTLFESGQVTNKGVNFKLKDAKSGYDIEFDIYFIFDIRNGCNTSPTEFYEGMTKHEQQQINSFLGNFIEGNRKFKWSTNSTSFMSILPTVVKKRSLIGMLVFMVAQGPDNNAQRMSYSIAPL